MIDYFFIMYILKRLGYFSGKNDQQIRRFKMYLLSMIILIFVARLYLFSPGVNFFYTGFFAFSSYFGAFGQLFLITLFYMGATVFPVALLLTSLLGYIGGIVYPTVYSDDKFERVRTNCENYREDYGAGPSCWNYAYHLAQRSMYKEYFELEKEVISDYYALAMGRRKLKCDLVSDADFINDLYFVHHTTLGKAQRGCMQDSKSTYQGHIAQMSSLMEEFDPMSFIKNFTIKLNEYLEDRKGGGTRTLERAKKWSALFPELNWTSRTATLKESDFNPPYDRCVKLCKKLPKLKAELQRDMKEAILRDGYYLVLDVMDRPVYPFNCEYRCKNRESAYQFSKKYQIQACEMDISFNDNPPAAWERRINCGRLAIMLSDHGEYNSEEYLKYDKMDNELRRAHERYRDRKQK